LRQAEADLEAARLAALAACHRRYLVQQSCEKAIKALGWATYVPPKGGDGSEINSLFFNRHDPLLRLTTEEKKKLTKPAHALLRNIETLLRRFQRRTTLEHIDATTPSSDAKRISYRYPFVSNDEWIAPADYDHWDDYQGRIDDVIDTADKLIRAVRSEIRR
jgi:hypothetical protein